MDVINLVKNLINVLGTFYVIMLLIMLLSMVLIFVIFSDVYLRQNSLYNYK